MGLYYFFVISLGMSEADFWHLTPRKAWAIMRYKGKLEEEAENPKGPLVYVDEIEG